MVCRYRRKTATRDRCLYLTGSMESFDRVQVVVAVLKETKGSKWDTGSP